MREGFLGHAFEDLLKTLEQCEREWSGSDSIPKRAALLFVDADPAMEGTTGLYGPDDVRVIRHAADKLRVRIGAIRDEGRKK